MKAMKTPFICSVFPCQQREGYIDFSLATVGIAITMTIFYSILSYELAGRFQPTKHRYNSFIITSYLLSPNKVGGI